MGGLRFGLIPRGEEGDARELELVAALSAALRRDVALHRAADYRVLLAGLEQRLVDVAWVPPLVCARALRGGFADPVAVVVRHADTAYTSALVTRPDSAIRGVADLRGVRVAWVDRESASGYAVLRAALVRAGVRLTEAFSTEVFARSHAEVVRAVLAGEVDVGATCAHVGAAGVRFARSTFAGDAGLSTEQLRPVFEAGPIPADVFAVRRDAPGDVRAMLERALLHGEPTRVHAAALALSHADGFATPTPEHRRLLEALVQD